MFVMFAMFALSPSLPRHTHINENKQNTSQNPRCGEPGCLKRPRYGEEGGRARFCAAHRFDDMVDLASRRSTGGASSGAKHCVSPAKRPRNGPRSIAHDSSAAAAAEAAAALPSSPAFSLRAAGAGGGGGGGRGGAGAPLATRGHTPAHAGGHRVSFVK